MSTFTFTTNGGKWKTGTFDVEHISIIGSGDQYDIEYDDLFLTLDGELYEGGISSFRSNSLSDDELFSSVVNAYLRGDKSNYTSFTGDWDIFDKVKSLEEWQGDIQVKLPVYDGDYVKQYELDLATPEYRYYSHDDEFLMLDKNGNVVTDMENFYYEGLCDDIAKVLTGKVECLYKNDYNIDAIIEDYGGEDEFLSEWDNTEV